MDQSLKSDAVHDGFDLLSQQEGLMAAGKHTINLLTQQKPFAIETPTLRSKQIHHFQQ